MYENLNFEDIPRGKEYTPALTIHSLNSKGQSARIAGIKTGRQHELLSINEQNYFFIAEFSDIVIDIREQFPMNIKKTLLIADKLGLKHPEDSKKKQPICMTSDFCITMEKDGAKYDIIRTVKPSKELINSRTIEKYEIERAYWENEDVDWGIVTDIEISKILAKNIRTFRDAHSLDNIPELMELQYKELCSYKCELARRLICTEVTTRQAICDFANAYQLKESVCITLFRHLIATKVLRFNMWEEFSFNEINRMALNHTLMDELLGA